MPLPKEIQILIHGSCKYIISQGEEFYMFNLVKDNGKWNHPGLWSSISIIKVQSNRKSRTRMVPGENNLTGHCFTEGGRTTKEGSQIVSRIWKDQRNKYLPSCLQRNVVVPAFSFKPIHFYYEFLKFSIIRDCMYCFKPLILC